VVSKSEFEAGLNNIGIRLKKAELNTYYAQFSQPINQLNFNKIFFPDEIRSQPLRTQLTKATSRHSTIQADNSDDPLRSVASKREERILDKPMVESIKEINQFMKKNTVDLKRTTLQEFLRGREDELLSVALEIDKNNDGTISKAELQ
jgi:hypothetical protein